MFITSASETGIVFICIIFPSLKLFSNLEALYESLCWIFKFVVIFM